jgi:V8-like Glu-specific endopeptidase
MGWQFFQALCATIVYLMTGSVIHAAQNGDPPRAPEKIEANLRQEIHIFLDGDRRALSSRDVEMSPFNAILKLILHYPGISRNSQCTAFAVDRSIIVTAAHCIHSMNESAHKPTISIVQGLSASTVNLSAADAQQIKVLEASVYYDGWRDSRAHDDCAVLKLDTPLPDDIGRFQLDDSGAICRRASHLETSGYTGPVLQGDPAGIRNVQSYDPDCHDRSAEFPSSLERIGGDKMIIDCSGDKGASGSPIYCSANGEHYAVGIFVGENMPLHTEAVEFGRAWNFAEKIASCAGQVRNLERSRYRPKN